MTSAAWLIGIYSSIAFFSWIALVCKFYDMKEFNKSWTASILIATELCVFWPLTFIAMWCSSQKNKSSSSCYIEDECSDDFIDEDI